VVALLYLYYNATFVQFQGRYLFSALISLGLAAAAGLSAWGELAERLLRRRAGWLVPAGALLAMAALCVFALYRFILPALA
jgi:predicted MFS family arabinose efflux permease